MTNGCGATNYCTFNPIGFLVLKH